jgi:hypothetical protein
LDFRADFLEFQALLQEGKHREALGLYRGDLLADSRAPQIEEARIRLLAALREATLESRDPEDLLEGARILGEDLEVWERVLQVLPLQDPRRILAITEYRKLL